jgi:predicted phage-related endonuclease
VSIEILQPASRKEWLALRGETIGASEIAALVGAHPWESAFSLWAKKSGKTAPIDETAAMRRGRHMESVALDMLREERPEWIVNANPMPGGKYFRDLERGIAATPDAFVARPGKPNGVAQVKSVQSLVFNKKWKNDDGEVEPPLYVVIQAIQEAALTGAEWACVVALVVDFGIDLHVIEVPIHAGITSRVAAEAAKFWEMIKRGEQPSPDYAKDGALIAALYSDSDDDLAIDLSGNNRIIDILAEREALKAREKDGNEAEKARKVLDAEIIHALGNASVGRLADGRIITAKTTRRAGYEVKPSSFRTIRIKEPRP